MTDFKDRNGKGGGNGRVPGDAELTRRKRRGNPELPALVGTGAALYRTLGLCALTCQWGLADWPLMGYPGEASAMSWFIASMPNECGGVGAGLGLGRG